MQPPPLFAHSSWHGLGAAGDVYRPTCPGGAPACETLRNCRCLFLCTLAFDYLARCLPRSPRWRSRRAGAPEHGRLSDCFDARVLPASPSNTVRPSVAFSTAYLRVNPSYTTGRCLYSVWIVIPQALPPHRAKGTFERWSRRVVDARWQLVRHWLPVIIGAP